MEKDILLHHVFYFAVMLHIVAAILTLAFIIPLQVKEVGVKNGLRKLRKQLLIKGVLSFIVILAAIFALTGRYFLPDGALRSAVIIFVLAHAIGIVGKSYLDYLIYHQQYTPKSKEMHEKIESVERGEARIVQKTQSK